MEKVYIYELLYEAEQDIRIIQTDVSVICQSDAEADRGLNNPDILCKLNSIVILLFTLEQQHAIKSAEAIVKTYIYIYIYTVILQNFLFFCNSCEIPLKNYAGTYRYDIYQSCPHADTRFIMSAPRYEKLSVGFQPISIQKNSTINNIKSFCLFYYTYKTFCSVIHVLQLKSLLILKDSHIKLKKGHILRTVENVSFPEKNNTLLHAKGF